MMMEGIIDKLFFRIHFSLNFELGIHNTNKVLLSIIWTLDQYLIWIDFFFVILMKPKCCYYYYFFPLGRILLCVHIYLDEIKVQTQNKYVLIVVHIWSMLQTSRVRYGKNSNASWPYYVFKQKGGREKKCILVLPKLTNMIFFVKEDLGIILLWRGKCSYISVTQKPNPFQ